MSLETIGQGRASRTHKYIRWISGFCIVSTSGLESYRIEGFYVSELGFCIGSQNGIGMFNYLIPLGFH